MRQLACSSISARRPGIHLSCLCLSLLLACGDDGGAGPGTTDGDTDGVTVGSTTDGTDGTGEPTSVTATDATSDATTDLPTTSSSPPATCGDGQLDPGEECDDGDANGDDAACTSECKQNACSGGAAFGLQSHVPARGATLAAGAAVVLDLGCAVDRETVTDGAIQVHGSQSGRREFTVAWTPDGKAELTFAKPLHPGERVDVTLTADIRDEQGAALAPHVFHFTASGAAGAATFTASPAAVGAGYPALGDVDGDGDLDIVRSTGGVFFNEGDSFTEVVYQFSCWSLGGHVTLADMDGDRDLDILCFGQNGTGSLWHNDGAGTFTAAPPQDVLNGKGKFIVGDLDGDGDLDVYAVTRSTDLGDDILLNDGTGVLTVGAQGVASVRTYGTVLTDVDGDGDLDVVYGSGGFDEPAGIRLNDGTGQFTASPVVFNNGAHSEHGIDAGDVDGDGAVDLLIMPYYDDGARVWRNAGDGMFPGGFDLGTENVKDALLRDIDGDGDLDIVSVNDAFFANANFVWLGAGDGSFTPGAAFGGGGDGLALGDVDGDGIIDAVVEESLFLGN